MKILFIEPFFTGSHKKFALEFQAFFSSEVKLLTLSGHHWKWRMEGGAIQLANDFLKLDYGPDVIICTSMLDLPTFVSLARHQLKNTPILLYFHENQFAYPWSPNDPDKNLKREHHYGFISYKSALVADKVIFNSLYNQESFLNGVNDLLSQLPDYNGKENITLIKQKSTVIPIGFNFKIYDENKSNSNNNTPIILWNHRWEYDKKPELFFNTLFKLKKKIDFKLIVLGEQKVKYPKVFDEAQQKLNENIIHFGYTNSFEKYVELLWQADILPVTSNQDFFGISVVEGIYCNCIPLLPNRLAYPEHLPTHLKNTFTYNSNDEFENKLLYIIKNLAAFQKLQKEIKAKTKTLDWKIVFDNWENIISY